MDNSNFIFNISHEFALFFSIERQHIDFEQENKEIKFFIFVEEFKSSSVAKPSLNQDSFLRTNQPQLSH